MAIKRSTKQFKRAQAHSNNLKQFQTERSDIKQFQIERSEIPDLLRDARQRIQTISNNPIFAPMFSRIIPFWQFYKEALTKYQLHSPMAFDLAMCVLEDERWYYAFPEIEHLRRSMRKSKVTLPVGRQGKAISVAELARESGISPELGRKLFRLCLLLQPKSIVSVSPGCGISTLYAGLAVRSAQLNVVDANPALTQLAAAHGEMLGLKIGQSAEAHSAGMLLIHGYNESLLDESIVEGYLTNATNGKYIILLNPHQTESRRQLWARLTSDARLHLSLDFWDLGLAIRDSRFAEKQHFAVAPAWWKLWKFM